MPGTGIREMMPGRVRQFIMAVTARLTDDDIDFVGARLKEDARRLFFSMSVPDQRHAINTARTALDMASGKPVDEDLLARAALLHDVGRSAGDLGTFGKVFAVVVDSLFGRLSRQLGKESGGGKFSIRRMLYIYYHHAEIGAARLSALGYHEEADIVKRHHETESGCDRPELIILRAADERN